VQEQSKVIKDNSVRRAHIQREQRVEKGELQQRFKSWQESQEITLAKEEYQVCTCRLHRAFFGICTMHVHLSFLILKANIHTPGAALVA
jgi:hypothetical protein